NVRGSRPTRGPSPTRGPASAPDRGLPRVGPRPRTRRLGSPPRCLHGAGPFRPRGIAATGKSDALVRGELVVHGCRCGAAAGDYPPTVWRANSLWSVLVNACPDKVIREELLSLIESLPVVSADGMVRW